MDSEWKLGEITRESFKKVVKEMHRRQGKPLDRMDPKECIIKASCSSFVACLTACRSLLSNSEVSILLSLSFFDRELP